MFRFIDNENGRPETPTMVENSPRNLSKNRSKKLSHGKIATAGAAQGTSDCFSPMQLSMKAK